MFQLIGRYNSINGETIQSIARAHNRSPRAIELRLQKLGLIPANE